MKLKRDLVWEALKASKWVTGANPPHEIIRLRKALATWPVFYLNPNYTLEHLTVKEQIELTVTEKDGEIKLALPFEKFIYVNDGEENRILTFVERKGDITVTKYMGDHQGKINVTEFELLVSGFQVDSRGVSVGARVQSLVPMEPELRNIAEREGVNTLVINLCEINGAKVGLSNPIHFVPERTKQQVAKAEKAMRNNMLPTWEYRLVEIDPTYKEPRPHQGGTHASPRQHERRGHYRHYKSGKVVWVEAHTVGDPTRGYIKHSYTTVGEKK